MKIPAIKLPETAINYKGEQETIQWPKGRAIANNGSVYLIRQRKDVFAVVYGLSVQAELDRDSAVKSFGASVMHQLECEGLL